VASIEDVRLLVVDRASHSVAYAKSWDAIEGYLAAAGAVETALGLEERAVLAGVRAQANRLANADHANIVRQSAAAQAQLEAIEVLRVQGRLDDIPEPLRQAADLRDRHPMLSLRELALRADPPSTKASMQRRLSRLVELADA
jgi:DNA-binding protein WhiA